MRYLFALLLTAVALVAQVFPGTGGTSGNSTSGNATTVNGAAVPAAQPCVGTNGAGQFIGATCSGSGGGVSTFNTRSGAVTPTAGDYTAAQITNFSSAASAAAPVQSVNGQTGSVVLPVALVNAAILYVSQSGSDSNACTSWAAACATIGGAIGKLPVNGTLGSGGNSYGTVIVNPNAASTPYIGPATTPWQWNQQIALICAGSSGTTNAQAGSCTVQARNNVGILSSTSDYEGTGFSHYLTIQGFTFDGNAGTEDLVREVGGGVNNVYSHVVFQNTTGHGVYLQRQMINFACEHCAFFDTTGTGGATYLNDTQGLNQITFSDIQVDRCGTNSCFYINQTNDNSSLNSWTFIGIKTEYLGSTAGTMPYVIRLLPYGSSGGNSFTVNVIGAWSTNTASGGGTAFAREDTASGVGARWHLENVYANGYTYAFQSAKTSQHSIKNFVADMTYSDQSQSYNSVPDIEGQNEVLSGNLGLGGVTAPTNLIDMLGTNSDSGRLGFQMHLSYLPTTYGLLIHPQDSGAGGLFLRIEGQDQLGTWHTYVDYGSGINTSNPTEHVYGTFIADGAISAASIDGVTSTTLGFVDPTSSIQSQLNTKATKSVVTASLTFGSINDAACSDQVTSFSGAVAPSSGVAGTGLILIPPPTLPTGIFFSTFASATNMVTIRLCNLSGATQTLGALTYSLEAVQ